MKRTFIPSLAFSGLMLLSFICGAQRHVNVGITLASPAAGSSITGTQSFNLQATLTNTGTDTLRATDTLAFYVTLDNSTTPVNVLVGSGTTAGPVFAGAGNVLPPNSTAQLTNTLSLAVAPTNGSHTFCMNVLVVNRSSAVVDNDSTNNKACNNINVSSPTAISSSIRPVNEVGAFYPNPACSNTAVNINLTSRQNVSVILTDMAGRVVYQDQKGTIAAGSNTLTLDLGALPNGIYITKIMVGEAIYVNRLSVRK